MYVYHLVNFVPRSLLPVIKLFTHKLLLAYLKLVFSLLACLVDDIIPVVFRDCMLRRDAMVMVGNFIIEHVYWAFSSESVENALSNF